MRARILVAATAVSMAIGGSVAHAQAARVRSVPARPFGAQIVGGETAAPGTFGMMAFIIYNAGGGYVDLCSGTVISANLVLTAGHCAVSETTGQLNVAANYTVVTGNVDWTDQTDRQLSAVSEVIPDPAYNSATHEDDAALLVLSTPTTVQPVSLAASPADSSLLEAGDGETLVGWGKTASGDIPDDLQYTDTVVQNASYCTTHATEADVSFDPSTQLCTIDPPYDTSGQCEGDSGGPLLADDGGTNVEVGIISFGDSNCATTQPGFLTRADAISSWADSEITALTPPPATPTPPTTTSPTATTPTRPITTTIGVTTPTTTSPTAASLPAAGSYAGKTSQNLPIDLRISAPGARLSGLSFKFRYHCARREAPVYRFKPNLGAEGWLLKRTDGVYGISRAFKDAGGGHYVLDSHFPASGVASGTLSGWWQSRRFGYCNLGPIRWKATSGS